MRDSFGRYVPGHAENNHRQRDAAGRWLPKFTDRFNIISLTDWHVPYQDKKAVQAAMDFCEEVQPNVLILHELHDFYSLSRFDKDPSRIDSLQAELDEVAGCLDELRAACPVARMILLKSNHLDRLKKYIWAHAQALSPLRTLQIPAILGLDQFDIEYMDHFIYNNFIFKHGDLVSKDAGMTARREMQAEGMSGVSGDTHRLGIVYHRTREASRVWIESGCLCSLDAEYLDGRVPNWQHGISMVSFYDSSYFAVPLAIDNGNVQFVKL